MLKALSRQEAQGLVRCPGWTCLSKEDVRSVMVAGMRAKVGSIYRVWVSLGLRYLGNELSFGAFEGLTVLLVGLGVPWQLLEERLVVHRSIPGYAQRQEYRRLVARRWQQLKDRRGKLTVW
jgi:hypothetical protein